MKNEQRVIFVFIISAIIMFAWTSIFPNKPSEQTAASQKTAEIVYENRLEKESTQAVESGDILFGLGQKTGSIQSIKVGGVSLMEQDGLPGLLQLIRTTPRQSMVNFSDGVSMQEDGLKIEQKIENTIESNYLKSFVLEIKNNGKEPKKIGLKILAYRPLKTDNEREKQFLGGSVFLDGKEHRFSANESTKVFSGKPSRIMSQGRSYATILVLDKPEGLFHMEHLQNIGSIGWVELPEKELLPGQEIRWDFKLYAGPMAIEPLKKAGLEEVVSFGAFSGITKILLNFLNWGYGKLHNYGLAICLLAVAVWLPFAPLTWYGMRASQQTMKKMALIKPQENRIRQEQKSNPAKLQQELMLLYKKHGVNPASGCIGCLPFAFTMPIYIALYQVLNRTPELRGASFLFIGDLSLPDGLIRLPWALPFVGSHLNVLPVVSTALSFVQQKAMQPPQIGELTEEQKIQQQMFKFMPLMFLFLFYNLPSGFMIYWVISSALTSTQQLLVRRSVSGSIPLSSS